MHTDNPIVLRLFRAGQLESLHRGAWVLVDPEGTILDGAGDSSQMIFPRSATKSFQALPLIESGAADRFGFDDRHLALALASHSGEPRHVAVAADGLARIGLEASDLRCGPQRPMHSGPEVVPERIINNCSGKHVGFLAVARHLDLPPDRCLDPGERVQEMVRAAVESATGEPDLETGIDGCSAPTFRMSLAGLATGIARVTNPRGLETDRAAACRRLTDAARRHPDLVAGTHERFCTDLIAATDGRVFGKIGAEGVYTFGVVDRGVGFAGKIDDGNARGLYPLIVSVLRARDLISEAEAESLSHWASSILRNWDGIEIGTVRLGDA